MLTYSKTQYAASPFLSIITRICRRPIGLYANLASIESLIDKDLEQIFINDPVGLGMLSANTSFSNPETRRLIDGRYVYLLDDDDFIINPNFITDLKTIANTFNPDVIFFRMTIKNGMNDDDYPTKQCWGNKPMIAHIGGSCFVVKKEVWLKYIHNFAHARCGDFQFINSVWESGVTNYWMDILCAETGRVSRGRPE